MSTTRSLYGCFAAIAIFSCAFTYADEPVGEMMILVANVNDVKKGEVFAIVDEANPYVVWIKSTDYAKFGIQKQINQMRSLNGEEFLFLASGSDLSVKVDFQELVLAVKVNVSLLERQRISFNSQRYLPLSKPYEGLHGYSNYDLSAQALNSDLNSTKLNVHSNYVYGGWVFDSDQSLTKNNDGRTFQRARSSVYRDYRDSMLRLSIGDVVPRGGLFSRNRAMGGLSISRKFEMRPDFVSTPTFSYQSSVDMPSTASIFIDGAKLRTVKLNPGYFEFSDLYYYSGIHQVEIEIQNQFGQRSNVLVPYYFSDETLRRGVSDYNITAGQLRTFRNDRYSYEGAGFSGYYRYGVIDTLTVGTQFEYFDDYLGLSTNIKAQTYQYGTFSIDFGTRSGFSSQSRGVAGSVTYSRNFQKYSFSSNLLAQSSQFETIGGEQGLRLSPNVLRYQWSSSIGYLLSSRQTISTNIAHSKFDNDESYDRLSVRYTRGFKKQVTLSTWISAVASTNQTKYDVTLTINIPFDSKWSGASTVQSDLTNTTIDSVMNRNASSQGEFSGQVGMQHKHSDTTFDTTLQSTNRFGTFRFSGLSRQQVDGTSQSAEELKLSGSIATIGGKAFMAQPIADAFTVVGVGNLPGVRVYNNNQLVGTTDSRGFIVIPNVVGNNYNQVRVDHHDLPIDYQIDEVERSVAIPSGQGIVVAFNATRASSIAGTVVMSINGRKVPVESALLVITNDHAEYKTTTGPDGDFYLDNQIPGAYRLTAQNALLECKGGLVIDDTKAAFIDIGEVQCERASVE